jgi:hypothetical protein
MKYRTRPLELIRMVEEAKGKGGQRLPAILRPEKKKREDDYELQFMPGVVTAKVRAWFAPPTGGSGMTGFPYLWAV